MVALVYLALSSSLYHFLAWFYPPSVYIPLGYSIPCAVWLLVLEVILWGADRRGRQFRLASGLAFLALWFCCLETVVDPLVSPECCVSFHPLQDALEYTCLTAVLSASVLAEREPMGEDGTGITRAQAWVELVVLLALFLPAWGAYFALRMYSR